MAKRYEAIIVYVVYEDDCDPEEALWSSGSSLAKALENYASDSAAEINVESATVVARGHVDDDE